jgi:hypothetical protein
MIKYILFKVPLVWLTNLNLYFLQVIVNQWKRNKGGDQGPTAEGPQRFKK